MAEKKFKVLNVKLDLETHKKIRYLAVDNETSTKALLEQMIKNQVELMWGKRS